MSPFLSALYGVVAYLFFLVTFVLALPGALVLAIENLRGYATPRDSLAP